MSANFLRASRVLVARRYASTINTAKVSETVTKATKAGQGIVKKLIDLERPIINNALVVKELAKEVYIREGMAFPSSAQWNQAKEQATKALDINYLKSLSVTDAAKAAIYSVEVAGIFFIGEVIGRRSLIGYNIPTEKKEHH
ncbi:uncharacterized protein VTP21DRAFT_4527 [Calcarisporiella thermophila]|uniref:uncharacterized protein n=1 Tax=Calcarisporiella thermophila TaxID=911321 RepID=UPI003742587A